MIAPTRRRVIFFDIDETLIDQRHAEAFAGQRLLETFSRELPHIGDVREFCRVWRALREKHAGAFHRGRIGFQESRRRRVRELFAPTRPELCDAEVDRRIALYAEAYRRGWRLFDDVPACLDALAGCTLGIISNGSSQQQRQKLAATGIARRFEVIAISEDLCAPKPEARLFLHACRAAGCQPREALHVGDRLDADARAAAAAGMRAVWLNRRRLPQSPGLESVASLTELPALLTPADLPRVMAASPEVLP